MPKIKIDRSLLLGLLLLLLLYFATRLYKLTLIPVFVDEAIYIRWSQVMRAEPTLRFLPLSDGKQPLFMWLTIPMFKLFHDPLFAGRFTSILAGLGSLVGISGLTWIISRSKKTTLIAILLYILTPFTLFFDRMALADSLLSMFGIWALLLGVLLVQRPRLDVSMLLGFALGAAVLTKSPGWYFLLLQPVLLFSAKDLNRHKILKLFGCWIVASFIAFAMYNVLRLGPNFHMIALRNKDYVFSFSEVLSHPLNPFIGHFTDSMRWLVSLLTWPSAAVLGFTIFRRRFSQLNLSLFLWALLPILFQASIAKAYTSRYFLFAIPPLLVIIAVALNNVQVKLKKGAGLVFLTLVFLIISLKSYTLLVDPPNARIPQNMKYGYFQEWTAGYGQKEVAEYLKQRAKEKNIVVGTEGFFGTLPDGLQIYTEGISNIIVVGVGQPISAVPSSLRDALSQNEVYLVVNKSRNNLPPIDIQNHVKLIASYPKPTRPDGTNEVLQFYQILK